ncbi:putative reverse transcriptase domain-containing protein [Tanacetum coccineum]
MEQELWTLTLKRDDIEGYNNRFHKLMYPDLVTPERKKIERYVRGLPEKVKVNVTSSKPANLYESNNMAPKGKSYARNLPLCNKCQLHHHGPCPPKCDKCQRVCHLERDSLARALATSGNSQQNVTCFGCGENGHYRNKCPKRRDQQNEGACGRAYVMRIEDPQHNSNVVTGTFLLNDHYASILFDLGVEKSFVSTTFTSFIDIAHADLDTSYDVELADGKKNTDCSSLALELEGNEEEVRINHLKTKFKGYVSDQGYVFRKKGKREEKLDLIDILA